MSGPLAGISVLDLTRVLAGPWATQLLADYGADVIKVERPGAGDDTRKWGPPWLRDSDGTETGESAYFLAANRNKRSITVDIAVADGQQIISDLAAVSDVIVENFRVGTMHRFGLGVNALQEINPRLVYCSISAFGQQSSRAAEPGYDAMIQAAAGLMSVTGRSAKQGGEPRKVGIAIADIMTGMYATTAIIAALFRRQASGAGDYIDLSLYDSQVAWLANQGMNFLVGGEVPERLGNAHPNIVPYQSVATKDGYLMLAVGNDRQFADCVDCLGLAELAADARFASNAARVEHREALIELLQRRFSEQPSRHWIDRLRARNIPASSIDTVDTVLSDSFADERNLVQRLVHPYSDRLPSISNPVRFRDAPVEYRAAPPTLGQHTQQILENDLGYSPERIQSLRDAGVV